MSQENVEIVRAAFEAISRGDVDAMLTTRPQTLSLTGRGRSVRSAACLGAVRWSAF